MLGARELGLQPGEVIAGKYEIVKQLQSGSMGVVYACHHLDFDDHLVAVKLLFPEVAADPVACARLHQEIYSSYLVTHPNIVRTYEYLREHNVIGYSMEYVDGGDLADRFEHRESFSTAETLRMLIQICAGVQAMHDARIVHRDLKPENILLTRDGTVKIADFGIVRMHEGKRLTEAGGVVGTIAYMSPEYMLRSESDWRSDIYAIGVLGYEMVTGQPPFEGASAMECLRARLQSEPAPPSVRVPCPPALDKILLRALAREPAERYQSAGEFQGELQLLLRATIAAAAGEEDAEETQPNESPAGIAPPFHDRLAVQHRSHREIMQQIGSSVPAEPAADEIVEIASLYGKERRASAATERSSLWRFFGRKSDGNPGDPRVSWAGIAAAFILAVVTGGVEHPLP